MASRSYVWSTSAAGYAAVLHDSRSGRSTVVRRPPESLLRIDDLIRLEHLALRAGAATPAAEAELFGALDTDPLRVLGGMNWLLAFWAVLWELRGNGPATALVHRLDYSGPWRTAGTAERDQMWRAVTDRVKSGVLAQLSGDPRAQTAYDQEVRRLAPDLFLHVTLTVLTGLGRDLLGRGLDLEGATARLAEHTDAGDGPLPPFSPLR